MGTVSCYKHQAATAHTRHSHTCPHNCRTHDPGRMLPVLHTSSVPQLKSASSIFAPAVSGTLSIVSYVQSGAVARVFILSSAAGSNVVEICCMTPLRQLAPTSMRGTMMVEDDLVGRPRRGMRIWTLLLARLVGVSKRSPRACLTRAHDASDWADDQAERARASAPKHVSN